MCTPRLTHTLTQVLPSVKAAEQKLVAEGWNGVHQKEYAGLSLERVVECGVECVLERFVEFVVLNECLYRHVCRAVYTRACLSWIQLQHSVACLGSSYSTLPQLLWSMRCCVCKSGNRLQGYEVTMHCVCAS